MNIKKVFKVIIAGGRDFNDYPMLKLFCDTLLITKRITHTIIIVSGKQVSSDDKGNKWGADYLGEQYAKENGFEVEEYPADWERYGKSAGMIRNHQMAQMANGLIAFWDGKSPGTKNMIAQAKLHEILVAIQPY